ncbi:MAG: hypothetical protein PHI35_03310 [Victivallaceae bacterium]|nr:hypothetical protein [Victivallaceae bacterium]
MNRLEIYRIAAARLGCSAAIVGDGEPSAEREAFDALYLHAVEETLTHHRWNAAARSAKLNRLDHCDRIDFKFAFAPPPDFVALQFTVPDRIRVAVGPGNTIYCDREVCAIGYTALIPPESMPVFLARIVAIKLAMLAEPMLAHSGKYAAERLAEYWQTELVAAIASDSRGTGPQRTQRWMDEDGGWF